MIFIADVIRDNKKVEVTGPFEKVIKQCMSDVDPKEYVRGFFIFLNYFNITENSSGHAYWYCNDSGRRYVTLDFSDIYHNALYEIASFKYFKDAGIKPQYTTIYNKTRYSLTIPVQEDWEVFLGYIKITNY